MTLPPPPTGFSAQQNVGALIALQATGTDMVPDTFGRNAGNPVQAVMLDIFVLDGPNAGQSYPQSTNTSALGRQFLQVAGNGTWYYGRITGQPVGQGTALILSEPRPGDEYLINQHKMQMAQQRQQAAQWGGPAMNGGQQPQQQYPQQQYPQQQQGYPQPQQPQAPWQGQPQQPQYPQQPQQPQPQQGPWSQPPPPQQPAPQQPWPTPPQQGYPQQQQPQNAQQQPAQQQPVAPSYPGLPDEPPF